MKNRWQRRHENNPAPAAPPFTAVPHRLPSLACMSDVTFPRSAEKACRGNRPPSPVIRKILPAWKRVGHVPFSKCGTAEVAVVRQQEIPKRVHAVQEAELVKNGNAARERGSEDITGADKSARCRAI